MRPTNAVTRLSSPENEPLRWLFGKILTQRAAQNDWECISLKFLEEGNRTIEKYWNESIAEFRDSLVNPNDAPRKAEDELEPSAKDFPEQLDSFVCEIIALRYLIANGFSKFKAVLRSNETTPDYLGVSETEEFPVEIKDLKLTASADRVLERIIEERFGVASGLNIALLNNSDKFLEKLQAEELRQWALNMPLSPGEYEKPLTDGSKVRIRIGSDSGDLRVERYVSVDSDNQEDYDGLLRKAIRVVKQKIFTKSGFVNSQASRKIAVLRWSVPPGCALDMETFIKRLKLDLEHQFKADRPDVEFYLFHDWWTGNTKKKSH